MLDPTIVPRTAGGHGCASGTLPAAAVSLISVVGGSWGEPAPPCLGPGFESRVGLDSRG